MITIKKSIRISFQLGQTTGAFTAKSGHNPSLECTFNGHDLTCKVYYDFQEAPLVLQAEAKPEDKVELILMTYRIELWVDGRLWDEEWPCGECLFDPTIRWQSDFEVSVQAYDRLAVAQPAVLGTFQNAEGWRPAPKVFVGDCMPYVSEGRYHVLYLKDRHHHASKWGLGAHQWEHISTADFITWQIHPMAIPIDSPAEGSICTGSWIRKGQTHYLFYTVRVADGSAAPICRSRSTNGSHFEKDKQFRLSLSQKYHAPSARDPKVFLGADGLYHMLVTTSLIASGRGCLAHLQSDNLNDWYEVDDPILICEDETQPECPDYIAFSGWYYLIFSLNGKAQYLISDQPFTGWRRPEVPGIPCKNVPKGAVWKDKIVFTGFRPMGGYGGTMTFRTATSKEDGTLHFLENGKNLQKTEYHNDEVK